MKYYIEVCDTENPCEYILQSEFFDTEGQALEWAKKITYLSTQHSISLMCAEWDSENDVYGDIEFVRYLR